MRIVALDTTSSLGSMALLEDGQTLEEMPMHSPEGFSQTLFPDLRRLLDRHGWSLDSVDCFAATSGPGSFTGVRVGLTAVKGLAEARGARAVGVSNPQALAACGSGALRATVADARRGEVYGAVYDAELRLFLPETVLSFPDWVASLPVGLSEIISPDFTPFRPIFQLAIPVLERRTLAAAAGRIARDVMLAGRIARDVMLAGRAPDAASIDANYVRRSDAELNWKDEPVARTP